MSTYNRPNCSTDRVRVQQFLSGQRCLVGVRILLERVPSRLSLPLNLYASVRSQSDTCNRARRYAERPTRFRLVPECRKVLFLFETTVQCRTNSLRVRTWRKLPDVLLYRVVVFVDILYSAGFFDYRLVGFPVLVEVTFKTVLTLAVSNWNVDNIIAVVSTRRELGISYSEYKESDTASP